MKITLHSGAEQDLDAAVEFYEREGSPLIASRFLDDFKRLTSLLQEHPKIGSPRSHGKRGFPMRVFPYTVIYRIAEQEIVILVVKHHSRRPGYGGKRR
jgi:plasmid stabilization system protein ParE